MKKLTLCLATIILCSCGNERLQKAESEFAKFSDKIKLDMTIQEAAEIIGKVNSHLNFTDKVPDEQFKKDNDIITIKYIACKYYNDDVITYDEFMPLVFKNNNLIGYGWFVLGNPYSIQRHVDVKSTVFGIGAGVNYNIK